MLYDQKREVNQIVSNEQWTNNDPALFQVKTPSVIQYEASNSLLESVKGFESQ